MNSVAKYAKRRYFIWVGLNLEEGFVWGGVSYGVSRRQLLTERFAVRVLFKFRGARRRLRKSDWMGRTDINPPTVRSLAPLSQGGGVPETPKIGLETKKSAGKKYFENQLLNGGNFFKNLCQTLSAGGTGGPGTERQKMPDPDNHSGGSKKKLGRSGGSSAIFGTQTQRSGRGPQRR